MLPVYDLQFIRLLFPFFDFGDEEAVLGFGEVAHKLTAGGVHTAHDGNNARPGNDQPHRCSAGI